MEQAELDVALEELETRLERLRALYEQYFMGIERIEPAIARKDVDRRIYVLRREKIRNTAKRFKLQTIIQRYNTFQQYWQRICREIENGTYKRHLVKAEKNGQLLTIAARKRLGKAAARTSEPPEAAKGEAAAPASAPPSVREAPAPAAAAPAAVAPAATAPAAPARPPGSPPLPPRRPPLPGARPADAAVAPAAVAAPVAAAAAAPTRATPPEKIAAAKFESLDLDMDFMGDWDPGAAAARRPGPPAKAPPAKAAPAPAAPAPAAPAARAAPAPSPPERPAPAPAIPARPAPAIPARPAPAIPARPAAPAIPPKPAAAAAPPPASPARSGSIPPRPVTIPPRPSSSSAPKAPARPLAPRIPPAPRVPAATPAARPAPPVAAPKPAAAAAAPKPAAAAPPKPAPAAVSGADDARIRELHSRLQQAKQQTKEANVSYEGLAKSIRATEAKLREQHKNRKIDFDVVIKDGKAVVKPIVR